MENTVMADPDLKDDMIEELNDQKPSMASINMTENANGVIPATQPAITGYVGR